MIPRYRQISPGARVAAAVLALCGACSLDIDFSRTQFACSDGETCPEGYRCIDQVCTVADGERDAASTVVADSSPLDAALTPAGPTCQEIFGEALEYQLCSESETTCKFATRLDGGTCSAACAAFGRACVAAYDNLTGPEDDACAEVVVDTCETTRSTEICECAREPAM